MTKKLLLVEIPDHLERNGEVKPSLSHLYKLSCEGELPAPTDYFGHRPRFDADEVLACWRARVQKATRAAIERAEQNRQFRKEHAERRSMQAEATGKNAPSHAA